MIYLLRCEAPYGELKFECLTHSMRVHHQLESREKYNALAEKNGLSLAQYLLSNSNPFMEQLNAKFISSFDVDLPEDFIKFGEHIFEMEYAQTPDYDYLTQW